MVVDHTFDDNLSMSSSSSSSSCSSNSNSNSSATTRIYNFGTNNIVVRFFLTKR